jgi:hypothetical protein
MNAPTTAVSLTLKKERLTSLSAGQLTSAAKQKSWWLCERLTIG